MSSWHEARLEPGRIGPLGWGLVGLRGLALGAVTYGCLAIFLLVRLVEKPLFGLHRPITPWITQFVCRAGLAIMGFGYSVTGRPMQGQGAIVANHVGWLDIFTLNAADRVYFVSKDDVANWPGIGILARATGTMFINRRPAEARTQQEMMETRLRAGHRLLFFPEGTSTDATRVLPFKTPLFQAFFTHGMDRVLHIQPVTVVYHAPVGRDPRYYGWWGDMDFAGHLIKVLATPRQGRVEVIFHPSVPVDAFADRKQLAAYCERVIRTAHPLAQTAEIHAE
ncbi:lyso-ornithine lipid acyltransferase [Gemmobacter caeni]|uniref:Lyso-ornithine lipid acyltransferase n=1 Tax=Gemmobacter caeni TaxID=589035 RepID=A0A2T6AXN2_9RHOB|nr:lysophospholipid acyltransferase family protein [Gemmobacter caeni]PTX48560.1 lyso-ornithine lipid acyltransferase [Gemmobacter caeni]TWI99639.1 lyso-ornithine lipid acyltransferase [Gemmobacter caeni]